MAERRGAGAKKKPGGGCPIVGVGASAGGLEAFRRLLAAIPDGSPLSFVIVQHLSPDHESKLAQILQSSSRLPVTRATNDSRLHSGHVYVIPEGFSATVDDGELRLTPRPEDGRDLPIDSLFSSLASSHGSGACGVLLSGTGADGYLGLREIVAAGGFSFVQDPTTAEYDGMPRTAIDEGVADFVGSPEEIAAEIHLRAGHPYLSEGGAKESADAPEAAAMASILSLLNSQHGLDFSAYKQSTVQRRIARRAMLSNVDTLEEYLALVKGDPAELESLLGDMLINVTRFFRDPEVFASLKARVFPAILEGKTSADTVRIWVPGCSTGEEVYSLLITLIETLDGAKERPAITIFGSDASEPAIRAARAGFYPDSLCADVSPEQLARFFVQREGGCEVERSLRDLCIFARQDLTRDTPFSRLDMVSLRNVLIYMERDLQRKVLAVAHYALLPEGFLLLGTSETPDGEARLFSAFDKQSHVYRRKNVAAHLPVDIGAGMRLQLDAVRLPEATPTATYPGSELQARANEIALDQYAPPRVVVDANAHILHFLGDTSRYLEQPQGKATHSLFEMARAGLGLELEEAFAESLASGDESRRELSFVADGEEERLGVDVVPILAPAGETYRLVVFRELPTPPAPPGTAVSQDLAELYESRETRLRRELLALRGRLRAVSEDKETVNLELRSANEEVRSSNEEFQSINEELETAKEELQSANEELITVNDELRQRNSELGSLNDDLNNFITSTDIPVVMLDCDLRVRRHTPQASQVMHIAPDDHGRPLEHIKLRVDVPGLEDMARDTIATLRSHECEVQDADGHWYSLEIRPYYSAGNLVEGAILSFMDIDEIKRALDDSQRRAALGAALNEIDSAITSTLDFDEIMQRSLDAAVAALGADAGTIELREDDAWVVRYACGFRLQDVGLRLTDAEAPNATRVAATREPLAIRDMSTDPKANVGFVKASGLKSVLAVPLIVRDEVVGSFIIYTSADPREFSEVEVDFACKLAADVSLALENSRLVETERRATRTAQTLATVNEILLSALTVDDVIARLVGEASVAAGADKSLVIRVEGGTYTITDVRGVKRGLLGKPKDASFFPGFALAAARRKPVLIGDTLNDPRTNKEFVGPHGLRAFQLLPLCPDGEVTAVLALACDEPQDFTAEDRAAAVRMADAMSMALRNAQIYEAEQAAEQRSQRELEFTQILLDSSSVVAEWTEIGPMLEHLADVLLRSASHTRVTIGLWDADRRALDVVASTGEHPIPVSSTSFAEMSAPARRMVRTRKPVFIDYTRSKDPGLRKLIAERRLRFALSVPIVSRDRLLGTITVDAPGEHQAFSEREAALIESIAAQAATAIENARLFQAEQQELARTTVLKEVAAAAASSLDERELSESVLAACRELLGAKSGTVHVIDDGMSELTAASLFGFPQTVAEQLAHLPLDEARAAARSYLRNEVVMHDTPDLPSDIAKRARAAKAASNRWIALPIRARGEVLGSLGLVFEEPRAFEPDEIALYNSLAEQLGAGVDKARLFKAEQDELLRTTLLKEIAAIGAGTLDLKELAERALETTERLLHSTTGNLFVVDNAAGVLRSFAHRGIPKAAVAQYVQVPLDADTASSRVARTGKIATHYGQDVPKSTKRVQLVTGKAGSGWVILPIKVRGAVLGTLGLSFENPRHFADAELSLFSSLTDQLGAAMEKAQLFEAERERARFAEALAEVDQVVHSSLDFGEIAERALSEGAKAIGAETGAIIQRESDGWLTIGSYNFKPSVVGVRLTDAENPHGLVALQTKKPVAVDDAYTDPRVDNEFMKGYGLRSVVVVPLIVRGRAVAGLYYNYNSAIHNFTAQEVDFVSKLASSLSLALENARLFAAETAARQQAKQELETTSLLLEAANVLAESPDLESGLGRLVDTMRSAIPGIRTVVYMLDEDTSEMRVMATGGGVGPEVGLLFPLERMTPAAAEVLRTRHSAVVDFDTLPKNQRGIGERFGVHRLTAIPAVFQDKSLGIVVADDPADPRRKFTAREIEIIEAFAAQAAAAIQNQRLLDAERDSRDQVQRELRTTELLLETAATLAQWTDVDAAMGRFASILLRSSSQSRVTVNLWDEERGELRTVTSVGAQPISPATFSAEVLSAQIRDVIATQKTLLFDYDDLPPGKTRRLAEERGMHLGLIVPVVFRGRTLGLIALDSPGERREFSDRDIELVEAVAAQAGGAVRNAQLFDQVKDSESRFRLLFDTMTEGFCINEIIVDDHGKPCDFRYLQMNQAFEQQTGLRSEDVLGHTLLELFPDSEDVWIERYGKVALTGEPDHFQEQFGPLGKWFEVSVYQTVPERFAVVFFDITERKAAEEAARESSERLTDTLTSMTDGFVSVNRDWRFTLVNPSAEQMLHRPADEVLGQSMKDLYPDMFGWPHYRKVMSKRKPDTFEVWSKPLETWLEIHAYPTEEGISILFTDITQRKQAEQRSQARLRMSVAAGSSETSADDMIRIVLDEIESLTGSTIGFYHFVEADQKTLSLQNWSTNTLERMCSAEGKGDHYPISEAGVWVEAVHQRQAVVHNDYASMANKKGMPEGHAPVTRELVVPVIRNQQIVALIGVGNKPTPYDDADTEAATYLGDLTWEMVERKRAEEALKESRARTDLLATMLDSSSQPFAAATASGILLDFNQAYQDLVGYSAEELRALSWRTDLTPPEWQKVDAESIQKQMTEGGTARYEKEYVRKDGTRVPVEVFRNIRLDENGDVDYFYAFFTDITERKRTERLERGLDDINRTIHSTLDFDTIMSRVSESAADALGCDSAEVLLLFGDTWVSSYGHDVNDVEPGHRFTAAQAPLASRAARERQTVLVDVCDLEDHEVAEAQEEEGVTSALLVPMVARDEVIGVLRFTYRTTHGFFAPADVDFAENLAASMSLAVENARLYQRERTIADTLQQAVLAPLEPRESVEVAYLYRPASNASRVGGDFYDLFETDDEHVAIVVGDISGKGVEAARLTTLVRDGIRAYAYENSEPGWTLTHVNKLVHRASPPESFATVFLGVLGMNDGVLRFCNAGHPPAIIVRPGRRRPRVIEPNSTIVGAFDTVEFSTGDSELTHGDIIVLYTDGVTEARRGAELFGHERLVELAHRVRSVPLEQMPQAILAGVLEFSGGMLSDDTVIVCVRPNGIRP